ncbi:MAG: Transcriptional regulator, TetR family [Nocardioides sp.]|nr:Transcriptional regulator, TetR family [Nocardioides sp.]
MVRLVRGSTGSARAGRVLYRVINRSVLNPVARASGVQASAMKLELVSSQLIGIAMLRYVVEVEPMASASIEEVVVLAAPAIRAALQA